MSKASRYCCVINCESKSSDSGSKKRTIFQVPTDSNRREKWLEVLSPHVREGKRSRKKLYICDLHFKAEDIVRSTIIVYTDGSVDEIPRETVRLKLTSVPSIFNKICQQGQFSKYHSETSSQSQFPTKLSLDISGLHISTGNENRTSRDFAQQNQEKLQNQKIFKTEVSADSDERTLRGDVSIVQNQEALQIEAPMSQESQNKRYSIRALTIDAAANDFLKNINMWTFTTTSIGLLFSFIGDDFPNVTRSIFVKNDMTVEVRVKGCIVRQQFLDRVGCFQDFLCIITTINEHNLCEGIDDGTPCQRGFVKRNDKRSSTRCDDCRSNQRRIKNRKLKTAKRAITKKVSTQKLVKNLKRKYQRLQKSVSCIKKIK